MKYTKHILLAVILAFISPVLWGQINLTQGLKLYFPFSGNANDASGNGNVATVNGPVLTADHLGNPNAAYRFDGVDDYISFINGPGMKPQYPFSFSCWTRINNTSTGVNSLFYNDYIVDSNYGAIYNLSSTVNGFFSANVGDGGTPAPQNRQTKTTTTGLTLGTWYHLAAIVYSATNMRLFINCQEVPGTYSGTGAGLVYSQTGQGVIGVGDGGPANIPESYTDGDIDEVRFYDRILSDDEIVALYMYPVYPPALLFALPTNTLAIPCGGSVNIDATFQGIVSYSWSNGPQTATNTFTTPGTYIITVDDGCRIGYDTLTVTSSVAAPIVTIAAPAAACAGQNTTLTATGATSYTWAPSTGLNTTAGPTVTANINTPATYTVIGTTACGADTASITLTAVTPVAASFNAAVDPCNGLVTVANTVQANNPSILWVWDNDTSSTTNPAIAFNSIGQHDISLITNPGTSCADTLTRSVTITVGEKEIVYFPNAFTPNGDGINELFGVYTAQTCLQGEFYVYNSWGENIFYTDQAFTDFWDGTYKKNKVPVGVYTYKLLLNTGRSYYGKIVLNR